MALKKGGMMGRGMLTLHIDSIEKLYFSYLPFLKNGGLFVETEKKYRLGSEVFMLLTLPDETEKLPVAGKVVWINPKGVQGGRPCGIGVHFGEMDKGNTRSKIETMLVKMSRSSKSTYTM
ncbi:PilZ domain-containing protein [Candidatus Venteria ishoeyi]|uniref:PilZ domain protein n=1 Tax=Candidatus Venteria ishoeyi TaxID=1899563 RepID=A0A1H6FFB0_9GAMM|nr:PilZ domain-containing protein [Candidatus Venteria ishoeyi]MDM8546375.1 PilZ domain-containing protein [Candidatus Venteria ishoeyi]SEH06898.1 PilZ domain protein [Candidatus Venteria ishoeyi]SEH07694.1 PilZ domain protein [Candidatus Venteria ishoeyi]